MADDKCGRPVWKIENEYSHFILTSNFYLSQLERIKFSKKYARGRVLFCSYGINTQYFCSRTLLNSKCKEVWHYDTSSDREITIRKLDQNGNIDYEFGPRFSQISENVFDCILSFEEIHMRSDTKVVLDKYKRLLKDDGTLIMSTMNRDAASFFLKYDITPYGFSKDDLLKILKLVFPKIEIFSQRNISNIEKKNPLHSFDKIFSKLKDSSKKILVAVDRKENFYKQRLQKTVIQLREKRKKITKKILGVNYVPIPFNESHNPTNFLLICKK